MVLTAPLAGSGIVMIKYGEITATIKVQREKAAGPTALCKEMERVRLDTLRAEQKRQTAAVEAAMEKDKARKEAKRIKRVARTERTKVELAELAAELAAGRGAVVALAKFEAVAKAAAAIKEGLEGKTLTLVRPTKPMLKMFRFGPHTLELMCLRDKVSRAWKRTR